MVLTMKNARKETYHGWHITVIAEKNMCSNFSFDLTDPYGQTQHITMGGDDEKRALERAKEMIDLEMIMSEQTH